MEHGSTEHVFFKVEKRFGIFLVRVTKDEVDWDILYSSKDELKLPEYIGVVKKENTEFDGKDSFRGIIVVRLYHSW